MKRGIYLVIFALAFIFVVNFASANIYVLPPQSVTCSNSNVNTIWDSIFQTNSGGIKVLENASLPDYCIGFKTEGTDFYYLRMMSGSVGNLTITNVTHGNYTEVYAWHAKISSAEADSLNNSASNLTEFIAWELLFQFAKESQAGNVTINSSSAANSEFTSIFKITPPTWLYDPGNIYYFGLRPGEIMNITDNSTAFTSSSGDVYGDGSGEHFIFSSYTPYNPSAQSSTVQNSTSAQSQTQNQSQSNSSSTSNLIFYLVVGIIVILIIGLLIYLIVSRKKSSQTTVQNQNPQQPAAATPPTNSS